MDKGAWQAEVLSEEAILCLPNTHPLFLTNCHNFMWAAMHTAQRLPFLDLLIARSAP